MSRHSNVSALPPVSARDKAPGGGTWPPQKEIAVPHPFDGPYAIMKGMQVEIGNLAAKLETEQQQRASEVQSLREEVRLLREALAKERSERINATTHLSDKLISEITRHDNSLKTLHDQTSAALRERTMVDDFETLCSRVQDLTSGLKQEMEERANSFHNLDVRIEINTQGDSEFAQRMVKDLASLRQMLESNTNNDKVFAGWVEPRVLMAGRLLQAGCTAPTLPPKVKLSDRAQSGLQSSGMLSPGRPAQSPAPSGPQRP